MITIEFKRNNAFFVAYVQRETEKAYLCEIVAITGVFDAVKLNRFIWLPKSAVTKEQKLKAWLVSKLDLNGQWEGVSPNYPN